MKVDLPLNKETKPNQTSYNLIIHSDIFIQISNLQNVLNVFKASIILTVTLKYTVC